MEQITVKIDGMMCGHCEAHMTDTFKEKCEVTSVTSSHEKGESVLVAEGNITDEQIKEAVAEAGYTFQGIERKPYEKKGLFGGVFAKK